MYESNNPSALKSQSVITETLLFLMKKYPYDEISVKQIILEAKLARKTFYRNFESKEDVLLSYIRGILLDYFTNVNNAKGDVLSTIFNFADNNRAILKLLEKNNMLHIPLCCMNEYAPILIRTQNKELNPFSKLFEGLNSDYLVAMNIGAIWNVISLWVKNGMKDDPSQVRETLEEYLIRMTLWGRS